MGARVPTSALASGPADLAPRIRDCHRGGPSGAVILLTMTAVDGVVYELFDDSLRKQEAAG
jgi:hypothetical protein